MADTTPRDHLAEIIGDAANQAIAEGAGALPEEVADAVIAAGWRPPLGTDEHIMHTPLVQPFGVPLDRRSYVQGVWDVFVKPLQSDDAAPQSIEDRFLMAILRAVYEALPEVGER